MNGCVDTTMNPSAGHNFEAYTPILGGDPLLYCRRCGDVRWLLIEATKDERLTPSDFVPAGSRRPWRLGGSDDDEPSGRPPRDGE